MKQTREQVIASRRVWLLLVSMIATFILTRATLSLSPDLDFNVGSYNVHHLFTGILLMALCGIATSLCRSETRVTEAATVGFGVGLSLALDEWVYLIATDGSNASYLLPISYIGGALMVGLACLYVLFLCWLGGQRPSSPVYKASESPCS